MIYPFNKVIETILFSWIIGFTVPRLANILNKKFAS